jgi:DNA repair ATPase RecN
MQTKTKYSDIPCEDAIAAMQRKAVRDNDSKVTSLIEALHDRDIKIKELSVAINGWVSKSESLTSELKTVNSVCASLSRDARMWRQAMEDAKNLEITIPALTAALKMLRDENEKLRDNQRAWA